MTRILRIETPHAQHSQSTLCSVFAQSVRSQDTSKKHYLYSEYVQNKAVTRDCHLKEFYRFLICVNPLNLCSFYILRANPSNSA